MTMTFQLFSSWTGDRGASNTGRTQCCTGARRQAAAAVQAYVLPGVEQARKDVKLKPGNVIILDQVLKKRRERLWAQ